MFPIARPVEKTSVARPGPGSPRALALCEKELVLLPFSDVTIAKPGCIARQSLQSPDTRLQARTWQQWRNQLRRELCLVPEPEPGRMLRTAIDRTLFAPRSAFCP